MVVAFLVPRLAKAVLKVLLKQKWAHPFEHSTVYPVLYLRCSFVKEVPSGRALSSLEEKACNEILSYHEVSHCRETQMQHVDLDLVDAKFGRYFQLSFHEAFLFRDCMPLILDSP